MSLTDVCPPFARLLCCSMLALLTPLGHATETGTDKEVAETAAPLIDAELTQFKPCGFGAEGEAWVEDGVLHLGMGDPMTGVVYTGDVDALFGESRQGYKIQCQATRFDGNDFFFGVTFPVGKEDHLTLVLGGWAGAVCGMSSLNGYDASENETTHIQGFKKGQWYEVQVAVTETHVRAWIDGERIANVERAKYHTIDTRPEVELTKSFGLATFRTEGGIKDLKVSPWTEADEKAAEEAQNNLPMDDFE